MSYCYKPGDITVSMGGTVRIYLKVGDITEYVFFGLDSENVVHYKKGERELALRSTIEPVVMTVQQLAKALTS